MTGRNEDAQPRRFRPYPEYRDSGVEWLGEIPAHWEVKRNKQLLGEVDERSRFGTEVLLSVSEYFGVKPRHEVVGRGELLTRAESLVGYKICREGDLAMNFMLAWKKGLGFSGHTGIVSPAYAVFRLRTPSNHKYFHYLLRSRQAITEFKRHSYGIIDSRLRLYPDTFLSLQSALPPIPEQQHIASFLDRETAKIDAFIAKKRQLIELLQEKRTALITRAVTRGLDPTVSMKDSGIQGLGEVPSHWHVRRLKHLLREPLKYGANEPAGLLDPDQPRYIRITDITEGGQLRDETFRSLPEEVAQPYLLRSGDLLFARSGATVGKTFRYEPNWGRAAYAGYLVRARLKLAMCDSRFLQYFTNSASYWDWLRSNLIQATIENVSAEKYANLEVPTPSLREQEAIGHALDYETSMIDMLISRIRRAIDHLNEYCTALISAAVTGKIDVRNEAA